MKQTLILFILALVATAVDAFYQPTPVEADSHRNVVVLPPPPFLPPPPPFVLWWKGSHDSERWADRDDRRYGGDHRRHESWRDRHDDRSGYRDGECRNPVHRHWKRHIHDRYSNARFSLDLDTGRTRIIVRH